jgi:hypothetical protein
MDPVDRHADPEEPTAKETMRGKAAAEKEALVKAWWRFNGGVVVREGVRGSSLVYQGACEGV